MNMTQQPTAKRSQDLKVDLRLVRALDYICRSMYNQLSVVEQLIKTGDAKGTNRCIADESLLWVENEIRELESLLGSEDLKNEIRELKSLLG